MSRLPISITEFGQLLNACRPPNGWGNLLAVAHSGGADSTCLLYLLYRWVSQQNHDGQESPSRILSLSVDHSLQSGSSKTVEQCRDFCEKLQIPFQNLRVPWSHSPFPDRPKVEGPLEGVARMVRYRVLFEAMKKNHAAVIAMGHHADDNVETLLMRLVRRQTSAYPMGMRRCRRWGMGSQSEGLGWTGATGMNHWVVRPLLSVPKERILATCELHNLHYIDDPTNFQPLLTHRNFVRHCLSTRPTNQTTAKGVSETTRSVDEVKLAISRLGAIANKYSGLTATITLNEKLYVAADHLSCLQDRIDKQVTQYLVTFTRPSPPSTLLLLTHGLNPAAELQRALVLRILRFVSPKPWGAPDSEALRRTSSLSHISSRLWNSTLDSRSSFSAGSEVLWTPVFLKADGRIRLTHNGDAPPERQGWMASRQPPIKQRGSSPCELNISKLLSAGETEKEFLWDNRFLITLKPSLISDEVLDSCGSIGSVLVLPYSRWFLPKIIWSRPKQKDVILGEVQLDSQHTSLRQSLAKFRQIRTLDAV
ncbi:hypothetical protein K439DRAFT_1411383 [Ramaria rubella]|nr:hypothetical protein K439DRAFT_1411383 [Ramaria rubella]